MARLIDANELMSEVHRYDEQQKTDVWLTSDIAALLAEQPTVDVVEVVRCKDCKHCYKATFSSTGYRCKVWGVYDNDCEVTPEHYCSYGEMKDND